MSSTARRVAALAAVVVALAGAVEPAITATRDAEAVMGDDGRAAARRVYERFRCLRDAIEAMPAVPTYIEPHTVLPDVEWYQRSVEMAFGHLPLVSDPADAQQELDVFVELGTGRCDDVDVELVPR
jgi:hypothetical protein